MAAPGKNPRNHKAIVLDRGRIAQMMRRGWTQGDIAREIGVSQPRISQEWKVILRELHEEQTEDAKLVVMEKLAEIAEVKREAWLALERSKSDAVRESEEEYGNGNGVSSKRGRVTEGRLAANAYFSTILQCIREECELRGLYPKKAVEVTGTTGVNWSIFHEMVGREVPDVIEGRILEALDVRPDAAPSSKGGRGD